MNNRLGIGLIGAGRMGSLHARIVATQLEEAELTGVVDADGGLAQSCAEVYGAQAFESPEEMLSRPEVGAVIIATPPRTHSGLIEQAAVAGKHIFCEKPIGWDLAEIDAALKAVDEAGASLQIGFNRRFDPNFARARRIVASGQIGRVFSVLIVSRDPIDQRPRGREDGDLFLDTTIHDLDMARFLLGDEATSVHSLGGVMADEPLDDPDTAITTVRFAGGATAVIDNSRISAYGYDQRIEVFGTRGMLQAGNERADTVRVANAEGERRAPPEPFFTERYFESYVEELRSFVECIASGTRPAVSGHDGRVAVELAWACVRSYREGRPIEING